MFFSSLLKSPEWDICPALFDFSSHSATTSWLADLILCVGECLLGCIYVCVRSRSVCVYIWVGREGLVCRLRWLMGWWEDNMLRTTTKRTLNSFIVTIMNLRENPCVCSLAIKTGWHSLPGTVSHRCPSLKDSAAPESFLANKVVISRATRDAQPWDKLFNLKKGEKNTSEHFLFIFKSRKLKLNI